MAFGRFSSSDSFDIRDFPASRRITNLQMSLSGNGSAVGQTRDD